MADDTTPPGEGQGGDTQGDAAQAADWLASLPADQRGFVENKGWKDPADVLTSYKNLEKLRGVPEDRLMKLPDDPNAEGAFDAIWDKLGRPEAPDKYTKALGDEFDDDVFKKVSETAHKVGVSDEQFKALQESMGDLSKSVIEAQEQQASEAFDAWKTKNPDGFQNAARLMANIGVDEDGLAGILAGDKAQVYDLLAKVASRSAESQVIDGDQPEGEFNLSPDAARQKIAEKMGDKAFMERYTSDNAKVRAPAIEEMQKLHEAAARSK